ncbi:fimbrial biogenesis outer membrane usher protein [Pseudomonas sp. RC4D1]|uniref:fimbria/pilus outer membrane usher protein n=1 Tax=Pseudomonas sp. RC4D1 TaxID=2834407 RepID=UPI001BCE7CA8|nr:fimbria/pilus outer membrane usher protein [Pseudomonas sp. RC4D1]MBS7560114.1 fimbrial biogenesis outer membrane usher protein [Pseudomonas sp. RC4D1]
MRLWMMKKRSFFLFSWCFSIFSEQLWAEDVLFSNAFFPQGEDSLDLEKFQKGTAILPGDYLADIFVNGLVVGRKNIKFISLPDGDTVACFTRSLLDVFGINVESILSATHNDDGCLVLPDTVSGSSVVFNMQSQELLLSVPQVAMRRVPRGYVDPDTWDPGSTAAFLKYNLNTTHNLKGDTPDAAYLSLDSGFNLGRWRIRNNGSANWMPPYGAEYKNQNTFIQRDLSSLESQLTLGETHTTGDLFDTLFYKGAQLSTDDRMFPRSLRGYAPVIRGIARSNARVIVRQGGNIVQESIVAPGDFVIDDLYSNGNNGDLVVTVIEADGSQQVFVVPYTSSSQLLRPGISKYSLTVGQLNSTYLNAPPNFIQSTFQYGLSNIFTGESGALISENYAALLAGLAMNTSLGAVAVSLKKTNTKLVSGSEQGESLRLLYAINSVRFGNSFILASNWNSLLGHRSLYEAAQQVEIESNSISGVEYSKVRNRLSLSSNQRLGRWGQLGFSMLSQSYWGTSGRDIQYQFSYSANLDKVSISLSANFSGMDISYLLSMGLPFEFGSKNRIVRLSSQVRRDALGQLEEDIHLSGSAGEYNYGLGVQHSAATGSIDSSIFGQYQGTKSNVSASLTQRDGNSALGGNFSGSAIAHPSGLTLSPFRSDTIAVVSAAGAQGAQVMGFPGVKLDRYGSAVIPYLRPYEINEVGIDPHGASMDVEINEFSRRVAPTAGAVLNIDLSTSTGRALLFNVSLEDGTLLPYGADVSLPDGQPLGVVAQGGQLYTRVPGNINELIITWGDGVHRQCILQVSEKEILAPILQAHDVVCHLIKNRNHTP